MSCQCQRGRHRASPKPLSRFVLPSFVVTIIPVAAVVTGLLNPSANLDSNPAIGGVDPYAGTITIAATPLAAPPLALALPDNIRGTDHTSNPSRSSERPTQSATGSPVTTSTTPAHPTTQGQDQEAPTASSEPTSKLQNHPNCDNLNSQANVIRACNAIMAEFPEVKTVIGHAHRPKNPKSCHHRGMALDLMTPSNELGDRIFAWAKAHKQEFEIGWMGWEVPDHFDHVHLSFSPCKG